MNDEMLPSHWIAQQADADAAYDSRHVESIREAAAQYLDEFTHPVLGGAVVPETQPDSLPEPEPINPHSRWVVVGEVAIILLAVVCLAVTWAAIRGPVIH